MAPFNNRFEKELAAVEGGDAPASGDASPAPRGSDDEGANDAPVEGEVCSVHTSSNLQQFLCIWV